MPDLEACSAHQSGPIPFLFKYQEIVATTNSPTALSSSSCPEPRALISSLSIPKAVLGKASLLLSRAPHPLYACLWDAKAAPLPPPSWEHCKVDFLCYCYFTCARWKRCAHVCAQVCACTRSEDSLAYHLQEYRHPPLIQDLSLIHPPLPPQPVGSRVCSTTPDLLLSGSGGHTRILSLTLKLSPSPSSLQLVRES